MGVTGSPHLGGCLRQCQKKSETCLPWWPQGKPEPEPVCLITLHTTFFWTKSLVFLIDACFQLTLPLSLISLHLHLNFSIPRHLLLGTGIFHSQSTEPPEVTRAKSKERRRRKSIASIYSLLILHILIFSSCGRWRCWCFCLVTFPER